MKPTNPTLDSVLRSRQFFAVELYTLTLIDESEHRYCSGDVDIVYDGKTYSAGGDSGLLFNPDNNDVEINWSVGTDAETLTLTVLPREGTLLGIPWKTAVRHGVLDGAMLRQDTAIMPTYGDTTAGLVFMFLGRIAEIDRGDLSLTLNVNSPMEIFANQQFPRNIVQPGCMNSLFDASCAIQQGSFEEAATIAEGSTKSLLLITGSSRPSTYFNQGKVIFTGGSNSGQKKTVNNWTLGSLGSGSMSIYPPLINTPQAGDPVTLVPGCSLSPSDTNGCLKFSNLANFRGFPDVPAAETAI